MNIIYTSPKDANVVLSRLASELPSERREQFHLLSIFPNKCKDDDEFSASFLEYVKKLVGLFNEAVNVWRRSLYQDAMNEILYLFTLLVYYGIQYRDRILIPKHKKVINLLRRKFGIAVETEQEKLQKLIYQVNVYKYFYMKVIDKTNGELIADRMIISDPRELIISPRFSYDKDLIAALKSNCSMSEVSNVVDGCNQILSCIFLDENFCSFLTSISLVTTVTTQDAELPADSTPEHFFMSTDHYIHDSRLVCMIETPFSLTFDVKYKVMEYVSVDEVPTGIYESNVLKNHAKSEYMEFILKQLLEEPDTIIESIVESPKSRLHDSEECNVDFDTP